MPEVDPTALARFSEVSAAQVLAAPPANVNPSNLPSVYRRLRQSRSPIGAMFRGLEASVGPEEALEFVATLAVEHGAA